MRLRTSASAAFGAVVAADLDARAVGLAIDRSADGSELDVTGDGPARDPCTARSTEGRMFAEFSSEPECPAIHCSDAVKEQCNAQVTHDETCTFEYIQSFIPALSVKNCIAGCELDGAE